MKIISTCIILIFSIHILYGKEIKNILLLNSYHTNFKWTNDITIGAINGIRNPTESRIFVEYMDFKRFQHLDYFYELANLYKYKYGQINIDGIICADNYAFQFFLDKGDSIWNTNIPVCVCGVNNIKSFEFDTVRIKNIKEEMDVKNTLHSILTLQPNLDSIIIISDQTLSGKIFLSQFLDGLKKYNFNHPYIVMDGTDYKLLNSKLRNISPENNAIILLSLYSNKFKIPLEMNVLADELLKNIEIPVYSFWDFLLGDLIVGGSLISGYDQGFEAAKLLAQRLDNPSGTYPTLTNSKYNQIFDFNLIQKYHLQYGKLSGSAVLLNQKISFWIKFKKQVIYFTSTLILLLLVNFFLITNIVRRKKIELKLIESEKRLELALNSSNEGLWDILLNERKVIYNDNFAQLLGYDSTNNLDINTSNWRAFVNKNDIPQIKESFLSHLNGISSLFKSEIQLYKKDGSLQHFAIHGKITERNMVEKPIRLTGIIMDISSQKAFESQLKMAKAKAEESDRLKSSFLANMSHEIRTPMNAILGFSDILHSHELTDSEKERYITQIKKSGENLLNIINDIIDISKIESGQLTIRKEKFDLNFLLESLKFTGKALIKAKDKNINLHIENTNNHFFIYSDPLRLEQILLNLISNAIKFTQNGFIKLSYYLTDNTTISFKVTDSGEGITKEDQLIIFERFRQAEKPSKNLITGTGLGLSITQSLVKMLGGSITVKSEIDVGSEFTVSLPYENNTIRTNNQSAQELNCKLL